VQEYGAFHLADYPIFLGIAVYLALVGLQKTLFGIKPLDFDQAVKREATEVA
jgi:hypothetical protein